MPFSRKTLKEQSSASNRQHEFSLVHQFSSTNPLHFSLFVFQFVCLLFVFVFLFFRSFFLFSPSFFPFSLLESSNPSLSVCVVVAAVVVFLFNSLLHSFLFFYFHFSSSSFLKSVPVPHSVVD